MPQRVIGKFAILLAAAWLAGSSAARGQDVMMESPPGMDNGALPLTLAGEGNYFSQDLGTMFRLRYNTESYGQSGRGNFDIGTMQVWSLDTSAAFFDGQVTLNELEGVGYNLGVGYRWLSVPAISRGAGRMGGISLWTDGTSTDSGNFFPQIGLSLESLGDMYDFRANGYLPLGPESQTGEFTPTGVIGLQGNSISELTQAVVNTSYAVADLEAARRLGSERDAWAFAGPYFVGNDQDDSVGYRVGVRGYAYPDLLLQFAVTDDEIFQTNATFSVTWFVGRTRTDFQPACGVPDRIREPVLRNDYVALSQSFATGGIPLTQPDGSVLRIVHVDSDAPEGGAGTFESPFNNLTDVNGAGSLDGDIILAHALSVFTGEGSTTLKNDQRLLGEGENFDHTVSTNDGIIVIPETFPGARGSARPVVDGTLADAIILAPGGNQVVNFDFQNIIGRAIFGTGINDNVLLRELDVLNGTNVAISLENIATTSAVTLDEFTYDGGADSLGGVLLSNFDGTFNATDSTFTGGEEDSVGAQVVGDSDGTVTFANTVSFNQVTGTAFQIDGLAGNELGGTVTVNSAITTPDSDTARSVVVRNTAATANIDFNGNITDRGLGILVDDNSGGTITFSTGTLDLEINTAGATAVQVTNNTGATIEFTGPVDIDNTSSANGLIATGGGTLRYSNTANSIDTVTGQVVKIDGMTIQAANGVVISDITRSTAATAAAVELTNNTGGPITLGNSLETVGQSGSLAGGANEETVIIDDSQNVTISAIRIQNGVNGTGIRIDKQSTVTPQTVTLNDLEINDGSFGVDVFGNTASAGALNLNINDTEIRDSTNIGLRVDDVDSGSMTFVNLDIDGDSTDPGGPSAGRGVLINRSNASFNFDVNSSVADFLDTTFQVNEAGVANASVSNITFAGDIFNNAGPDTAGESVIVQQVTGGTVNFTAASSIEDVNEGIFVQNNTGGTISFLGDNNLNTDENTAVTVTNNTGATVRFSNLDIDTDEGNGFVATGGGTLEVTTTAGTTNTITTQDGAGAVLGVGMQLEDMIIGAGGVTFQEIDVTDGDARGIVLSDLTGTGTVTIGTLAGNASELTTVGDAIVVENAANVVFNNVQVVNASNAASQAVDIDQTAAATTTMNVTFNNLTVTASGAEGIDVDAASAQTFNLRLNNSTLLERVTMDNVGAGPFRVLLNNTDIDITATANTDNALEINFNSGTVDGDVTIQGIDSDILADGGRAFEMTVNGSASVEALIENTTFDSNAAEDFFLRNNVGSKTDATIRNNTFDAGGAPLDVQIQSIGSAAFGTRLDLNLFGNGPDNSIDIELFTSEDAVPPSNFGVVDLPNVDANNAADVTLNPPGGLNFDNIPASDVELPNGP